jgi:hypothetical protein
MTDYPVSFRSRDSSVSMVNRVLVGWPGIAVRFPVAEIFLLSTAPNTTESPWRHVYWLVDSQLRLRTANCNTGRFLSLHFADHQHLIKLQQISQAARHPDTWRHLPPKGFVKSAQSVMRGCESYVKLWSVYNAKFNPNNTVSRLSCPPARQLYNTESLHPPGHTVSLRAQGHHRRNTCI